MDPRSSRQCQLPQEPVPVAATSGGGGQVFLFCQTTDVFPGYFEHTKYNKSLLLFLAVCQHHDRILHIFLRKDISLKKTLLTPHIRRFFELSFWMPCSKTKLATSLHCRMQFWRNRMLLNTQSKLPLVRFEPTPFGPRLCGL